MKEGIFWSKENLTVTKDRPERDTRQNWNLFNGQNGPADEGLNILLL